MKLVWVVHGGVYLTTSHGTWMPRLVVIKYFISLLGAKKYSITPYTLSSEQNKNILFQQNSDACNKKYWLVV